MSGIAIFWKGGLAFCPVCHSPLAGEEIDFETCDACDGEGFPDEDAYEREDAE